MAFKVGAVVGTAKLDTTNWDRGEKKISKSSAALGGAVAKIAAVGFAALSAAIIKVTIAANKYQKAFGNVTTLLDESQENFQEISLNLLKLDSRLGETTDLTQGLYQAISAGAEDAEEAFEIVTQSATFATAALTDTATAVDVITTAMNAYGSDVVNATQAADLFFTTIKKGKITGEQLSATIGQSIPLFSATGIELKELTAGMAAMTKMGVNAANSTTQLNAIVNSFLKPQAALTELIKEQGFESGAALLETEGLSGALKILEEATLGDATELAKLLPNVRALRGAMALTGRGGEEFKNILQEMGDVAGATQEAFEKQEKTFKTLQNEFGKTQIIIGNVTKSFADQFAVAIQDSLEKLNKFLLSTKGMEFFAEVVGKITGGWKALQEIMSIIADEIGPTIQDVFSNTKKELEEMFGEIEFGVDKTNLLKNILLDVTSALKLLSIAINIAIRIAGEAIIRFINFGTIMLETAKIAQVFWKIITGKGNFADLKNQIINIGKAYKELGLGIVEGVGDIVEETIDQFRNFDKIGTGAAERIQTAFAEGAKKSNKIVQENYMEMITGAKKTGETIQESSDITTAAVVGNYQKQTESLTTALETGKTEITTWKDWVAANLKTVADKFKFAFDTIMQGITLAFDSMSAISSQFYENEFAKLENEFGERQTLLDEQYASELAALQKQLDSNLISEAEFNTKKEILDTNAAAKEEALRKEQLTKENALKKKQFESDKRFAIGQIWMKLAQAIMGFWAAFAAIPPLAIMYSAIATGAAIAQSVLVGRQQFVPSRQEGGTASGLTKVNEKGGELMVLPDQTVVIPNDISRDIAKASGSVKENNVMISMAGAIISDDMSLNKVTRHVARALGRELQTA